MALGIGAVVILFFSVLPVLTVVLVYVFVTIYAIAKAFGAGGHGPNPATILVGVALIIGALTTLLCVGVERLGRSMDPRRRGSGQT